MIQEQADAFPQQLWPQYIGQYSDEYQKEKSASQISAGENQPAFESLRLEGGQIWQAE